MQNEERIRRIDMQIIELDKQIKSAESSKSTGIVLMIVSLVILWPLLIAGLIMFISASNNIKKLEEKKQELMLERLSIHSDAT